MMSTSKKIVVIGAGLGGLSAAIALATEGFNVEVYEKNDKVGGKLNIHQEQGFSFDLGPSILTLPHYFERLFTRLNKDMNDYFQIQPVIPHWRCFFEDGAVIDLYKEIVDIEQKNDMLTKKDMVEIENFLNYSKKLYDFSEKAYFEDGSDNFKELIKNYGLIKSLRDSHFKSTVHGGVAKHFTNPYLIDIFDFLIKYVGASAYDAPAILNLMAHVQFKYDLWYVKDGMYNIASGFARLLQELGVKIFLNSEVVSIDKEGHMVKGIVLKDGSPVSADIIVSNCEFIPAYERLLEEDKSFVNKYNKFEPSCSGLVLHLGVNRKYEQLRHHNFFFSKNQMEHFHGVFRDKVIPDDPTIYLVAAGKTDSSVAPAGCENIKVLPHIPYIKDEPYTLQDYLNLKEKVYDKLERMGLEDLRKHLVLEIMWTPEDIQKHYHSNRGSIYGVVSDKKKNRGFKGPKQSSKYKNLYFVGGSVNPGGGMPMVVLSGQQTRDRILNDIIY